MTTNRGGGGLSANSAKRKVVVSYTVRNEAEPGNRLGVNALQYDSKVNRLFTAGRDSIIRCWSPDGDKVKNIFKSSLPFFLFITKTSKYHI